MGPLPSEMEKLLNGSQSKFACFWCNFEVMLFSLESDLSSVIKLQSKHQHALIFKLSFQHFYSVLVEQRKRCNKLTLLATFSMYFIFLRLCKIGLDSE